MFGKKKKKEIEDQDFDFQEEESPSAKSRVKSAINPFGGHRKWVGRVFKPWQGEDHTAARNIIKKGVSNQIKVFKNIKNQRNPEDFEVDPRSDFGLLLDHWGIKRKQLAQVVRALALQSWVFLVFGFYGVYLFIYGLVEKLYYPYWIYSFLLVGVGFSVFIMRRWRISVLKNRKFQSFKSWVKNLGPEEDPMRD